MTEASWEYYGREGPSGEIYEVFRTPTGCTDDSERFARMQRLHRDMQWRDAGTDRALRNEWASGWFSFGDNRLAKQRADTLVAEWSASGEWPGRP